MTTDLSAEKLTGPLALLNKELQDEAVGYNTQLVVAKINHQEGTFSIPSLPSVSRLEGIVLASRRARLLYPEFSNKQDKETVLNLTNKRPFCISNNYTNGEIVDIDWDSVPEQSPARDLKDQVARGGLVCGTGKDCPLNDWGSVNLLGKDGKGKACKEIRRLLFWSQGISVPILLTLTVSSIKSWDGYCSSLDAVNAKHNGVVTEITLTKKENYGETYHAALFSKNSEITEGMAAELMTEKMTEGGMKKLYRHLIDIFTGREIGIDEYENGESSTTVENDEL